ncbi:MAG TPA: hypothetical protein VMV41_06405 [Cellulomonadaceae bacterium]|nr:hypothetical protein [Cellulomonadaceae bacterium]
MSDELSAILRAAARDEAAAAEGEFPYSSAVLGRYVGDVRRRRAAGMATLAVAAVTVGGLAALGVGQLLPTGPTVVSPLPAATSTASPEPSVTPTPTAEPSTTPAPSPTPDPSPSSTPTTPSLPTTAPPPPSTTPTVAAPGPVTGVKGSTGGGSGETMVTWDQGADATGYRVYRSDSPAGPFVVAATFDVATGKVTIAPAFINDYVIIGSYGDIEPQVLYYVDAIGYLDPTYYRVAAFTSGGEGPLSPVVCATPPGSPFTC